MMRNYACNSRISKPTREAHQEACQTMLSRTAADVEALCHAHLLLRPGSYLLLLGSLHPSQTLGLGAKIIVLSPSASSSCATMAIDRRLLALLSMLLGLVRHRRSALGGECHQPCLTNWQRRHHYLADHQNLQASACGCHLCGSFWANLQLAEWIEPKCYSSRLN